MAGDKIRVFCRTGYTNTGTGSLTCTPKGWDKKAMCEKKKADECPGISISNGNVECKQGDKVTTSYTKGASCSLTCNSGFKITGNADVSYIMWNLICHLFLNF